MKPKGEVNYIAVKQRKSLWIGLIVSLSFLFILILAVIIKLFIFSFELSVENKDLKALIETQKSMIADLQEDNINLQKKLEE